MIKREQSIDNTSELQRFYIDEEYRNLRLGSKVMSKIKEIAKDMKYSGLSLKVYCNKQYDILFKMYFVVLCKK